MHSGGEAVWRAAQTGGRGEMMVKRGETMEGLVSEEDEEAEGGQSLGAIVLCTASRKSVCMCVL